MPAPSAKSPWEKVTWADVDALAFAGVPREGCRGLADRGYVAVAGV